MEHEMVRKVAKYLAILGEKTAGLKPWYVGTWYGTVQCGIVWITQFGSVWYKVWKRRDNPARKNHPKCLARRQKGQRRVGGLDVKHCGSSIREKKGTTMKQHTILKYFQKKPTPKTERDRDVHP